MEGPQQSLVCPPGRQEARQGDLPAVRPQRGAGAPRVDPLEAPVTDRPARRRWRIARPRWEADHIIPVADGGGECGLDNYRVLCRPCHVRVTVAWRATRTRAAS